MNFELKMHNIRIAWRNLMKYKVQNIISVLCLAVGMVIFSITFILTQRTWQFFKREGADSRRAKVELYTKKDSLVCVEPSVIQRIANSHLSSIDFIDIHDWDMSTHQNIIDHDGKTHQMVIYWKWISPEHLNYLGLRSAITGKRIPVLKPGDMIMSKLMLKHTFGLGVNPIGYTLEIAPEYNGRKYNTIIDVVDTGDWMLAEENIYVVTDQLKEFEEGENTNMKQFDVILAKGKTDKDLQRDLQKVLPEYKVRAISGYFPMDIRSIAIMSFVGCSILIIGLFGFLKTQIQLFRLRQREMGLRQCMGAHREQLFSLMMWEVAIVFFFVALIVLGLSGLLAEYAIPIIENLTDGFYVDMPHTYATELWICLVTFLVTTGIAALSVRKVVTTPLSEVVGKSHRVSTRGRSLLIGLQMVICQLFIFFFISFFYFGDVIGDVHDSKPANQDALRRCIVTTNSIWKPEFKDSIPYLKHVSGSTHVVEAYFRQDLKEGDSPFCPRDIREEDDGTRYCIYEVVLTDEHIFSLLDLEIFPSDTKEKNRSILAPIYAPSDRADELRQKLGLKKAPTEYRIFEKDRQAEKIGYVRSESVATLGWNEHIENPPFYLCDQEYFLKKDTIDFRVWKDFLNAYEGCNLQHNILFIAKPGEYKKAEQELTDLYQKLGKYTSTEAPVENMYESGFSALRMMELMIQIMFIMAIVALLCIVMTLFSSVSLDTRGRQKEVAIRKTNGAGMKQIMWLFCKQYVWQLIISSIISLIFCISYAVLFFQADAVPEFMMPYLCAFIIVALVTLLTVGFKIYRVSKLNPAKIIKKE